MAVRLVLVLLLDLYTIQTSLCRFHDAMTPTSSIQNLFL